MTIYSSFDENSDNVTFSSNKMGILSVDPNNINIDDVSFDPETIIRVRLLAWCNKFEKRKAFKKEISGKN